MATSVTALPGPRGIPRLAPAFALAVAAHAALLFGFELPRPGQDGASLRVTLSVAPTAEPVAAGLLAASAQRGPDARSQRPRLAGAQGQAARVSSQTAAAGGRLARAGAQPQFRLVTADLTASARPGGELHRQAAVASARADLRAAYLATWQQRVEALGTRAFPDAGLTGGGGQLTLKVTLDAGGGLREAKVTQSSGNRALDAAALQIVRAGAPYPPFPAELAAAKALTFAYVWRFVAAQAQAQVDSSLNSDCAAAEPCR